MQIISEIDIWYNFWTDIYRKLLVKCEYSVLAAQGLKYVSLTTYILLKQLIITRYKVLSLNGLIISRYNELHVVKSNYISRYNDL